MSRLCSTIKIFQLKKFNIQKIQDSFRFEILEVTFFRTQSKLILLPTSHFHPLHPSHHFCLSSIRVLSFYKYLFKVVFNCSSQNIKGAVTIGHFCNYHQSLRWLRFLNTFSSFSWLYLASAWSRVAREGTRRRRTRSTTRTSGGRWTRLVVGQIL